ncbi:MAG: IS4 family transposase [Anaerolineae bacterium]|nr:MAG: IS4 family transposase [Anaerolineae bacterium]
MYKARSVYLSLIARQFPIRAKKLSLVRRLERFLDNGAIRVREWYKPVAASLLKAASSDGQVHLVIDATKVGRGHQLLMVAVAYRRRALPLAWTWIRTRSGHSTVSKQVALLTYVYSLLPEGIQISLAGDGEFGNVGLLRQLDIWGWDYALRLKGTRRFWPYQARHLYRLDRQKLKPGTIWWLGRVNLTASNPYITNLVLYRAHGEPAPWYLATNLPSPHGAIMLYRRRMWIEEMFGDVKGHGFDLEATRLGTFLRLSRLTLAICLVYLWLVATGEHVMATNQASEVDRNDRRDLSIFRIGWDFIERRLALDDPIPITFVPNISSATGD